MSASSAHDPEWQAIVAMTHAIAGGIHTEDNSGTLQNQLNRRNEKIRDYFADIDRHSERLHGIKQRIADLLSLEQRIIRSCRSRQAEALHELGVARRAEQGLKAYSANQATVTG